MKIAIHDEASAAPGTVRVRGAIESVEGTRNVWLDLPDDAGAVTGSGNPWLAMLLPLAMQVGEQIELSEPVDPLLLENARYLTVIWQSWYPELKRPQIDAPTQRARASGNRVAQFFSGGVDSWFTLLRHTESTPRFPQVGNVDDLVTVSGFDIPIDRPEEFRQLGDSVREVAEAFGKRHLVVATNLRDKMTGSWKAAWGPRWGSLSHVAALASVALLLERRFSAIKIGSTGLGTIPPWGSHPMTDALFSTSALTFMHDHALYNRAEKLERIAQSDFAMSKLKVCFAGGTFRNCSRCSKCHRTLMSLDILAVLEKASSFDVAIYRENRHRLVLVWSDVDHALAWANRELALRHGRHDIATLIERSIARSRRVKAIIDPLRKVSWRAGKAAYSELTAGMIGA